jgi:hypothetical protein
MKWGRMAIYLGVLGPMAVRAVVLPAFQSSIIQPGQRIYVVAVRDSRLFTLNIPDSDQIKTKTRSIRLANDIFRPGNNQLYILPTINCQWHVAFPGRPPIVLPVPTDSLHDCEEQNPLRPTLEGPAPDRTRPDAEIKRRIEKEFQKQKLYPLAESPDQADYVFLVEGRYFPSDIVMTTNFSPEIPKEVKKYFTNEHLESALAVVVPSASYRRHQLDNAALLASRLWDGEILGEYGPKYIGLSPACAAPVGPCSLGGVAEFFLVQKSILRRKIS